MKLYHIRNWSTLFENNRSRTVEKLAWVAIPNRHDGENYSALITSKDGAEIFAAWVLIIQVASKCQPRGSLLRGDKTPHDSSSLSLKTRAPKSWFEKCLCYLETKTDWLEIEDIAEGIQPPVRQVTAACQAGDEGKEGKEGKDRTEEDGSYHAHSRIALHWLNEKSGSRFREVDASLKFISARLNETGVEIEGVKKMIDRQCAQWLKTDMEKFLRPATLFNETKFEAYYAAKDQPIQKYGTPNQRSNPRLEGVSRNPINNYATAKRRVEPEVAQPADAPPQAGGA